jgi:hypothetical protein
MSRHLGRKNLEIELTSYKVRKKVELAVKTSKEGNG